MRDCLAMYLCVCIWACSVLFGFSISDSGPIKQVGKCPLILFSRRNCVIYVNSLEVGIGF